MRSGLDVDPLQIGFRSRADVERIQIGTGFGSDQTCPGPVLDLSELKNTTSFMKWLRLFPMNEACVA